ncbi:hypothetical protein [Acinetobacter venetianus]|uniref:hypothetical protein n=1 Tax=Acinetobacter venetianus TaxID=52133 RepID=UPI003A934478
MNLFKKISIGFFIIAIAYCLSMLIFITVRYFFNENAEMISAFGAVLSAIGSFFAALIALYLFNGWRITEDHKTKNNHINNSVTCFLKLQDAIKASSQQGMEIHSLCVLQNFSFNERTKILILISTLQAEISFILREFTLHIQMFSTVGNENALGGQFEEVIDRLNSNMFEKYNHLAFVTRDKSPQQILDSLQIYTEYLNDHVVLELHKKIIIEMTKKSKAVS